MRYSRYLGTADSGGGLKPPGRARPFGFDLSCVVVVGVKKKGGEEDAGLTHAHMAGEVRFL